LEEEIRAEALVRNIGPFARFLELAASESGRLVNFRKLSQEVGVAHTTIIDYYQVLEDCLIVERVDPLTKSRTRRKLTRASKYIFFDLGIRRVAGNEGHHLPLDTWGHLFEQFVGLEMIREARLQEIASRVLFWRDPAGPEVDWILEREGVLTPVEVKWTKSPSAQDAKHISIFLDEYQQAKQGFLICQIDRPALLTKNIMALPWQKMNHIFSPEKEIK
jgi:predicted AAA+ superfamily ATPase